MHPTIQMNHKTLYSIYDGFKDPITKKTSLTSKIAQISLRSNDMYQKQVIDLVEKEKVVTGIKGYAFLSKWISIPDHVIFDYMHLCILGTFKYMFNSFFDSTNWREPYYLSNLKIILINIYEES